MSIDFSIWTEATGDMPWGTQRAFKTALESVADGAIKMVYGADAYQGSPCLVNAVNQMVSHNADASPSNFAPAVVIAFDSICGRLHSNIGFPESNANYVTPLMAEFLLRNFGPLKPEPEFEPVTKSNSDVNAPYVEKSDDELMGEWLAATVHPEAKCDVEPTEADVAKVEEFLRSATE